MVSNKKTGLTGYLIIGIIALAVLSWVITASNSGYSIQHSKSNRPTDQVQSAILTKLLPCKVSRVIDGDTIEVSVKGAAEKVRLIGVDTPETKHPDKPVQPYGLEAAKYTEKHLAGKQLFLEMDASERDQYGRLLAYVWLAEPTAGSESELKEKMFNARLILDGYARIMTIPPNVKYADYFTRYQTAARDAEKGLWGIDLSTETQHSSSPAISNEVFIGSSKSDKYHYPDCRWAKKINQGNLVSFNNSAEAKKAGYTPCKVCSPP